MNFMTLFCGIPFVIVLVVFILSIKLNLLREFSYPIRFILLICSLVPIWGMILAIFGIIYLLRDMKMYRRRGREKTN